MKTEARRATLEMIAAANPPEGYSSILSTSPFGWENGPIFNRVDGDGFKRGFRIAPKHLNAGGVLHGGMVMTFADIVLAQAVSKVAEPPFVTIRLTSDFIGIAVEGDWVEGTATAEAPKDGIVAVQGIIEVGGRVIASAQGLFKTLRRSV